MSVEDNEHPGHDKTPAGKFPPIHQPPKKRTRHLAAFGITAFAILAVGAAGGAGAMKLTRPSVELAPMTPVAISSMPDWSLVTIKGKVSEVFGNKFIVQDDSGRALVETGPAGDNGKLVDVNELITVQGRFEHGFLHGSYIVGQDGRTEALGPAGGPPHHGPLDDLMRRDRP
ncbi:hypothetical protein [Rhizobium rhizogenes]|uniref:hypothetical protein n=1 Tax=Rhizobium rhizogenes TaxID=359 RepID=UPI0015732F50|nr:hypothetical protein [Rhizobium rhizogenes]NTI32985.1 hypothetical protein [Rhizobium rhizogenes]